MKTVVEALLCGDQNITSKILYSIEKLINVTEFFLGRLWMSGCESIFVINALGYRIPIKK